MRARPRPDGWRRLAACTMALAGCAGSPSGQPASPTAGPGSATASADPAPGQDPVVLAAGDIASCDSSGDEATAALLAGRPGSVLTLGDDAYESGSVEEFTECYEPTWGSERGRTHPAPGNHEYMTAEAAGYFAYFGDAAGDPGQGYYSFDVGNWHVVSLNSNCGDVSCAAGDRQQTWLDADLAASDKPCTLAFWHHPLFNSGEEHGPSPEVRPLYQTLFDHDADLVLVGHEHLYERFAPLDPSGTPDAARGVREFVVGTGGRSHYRFATATTGSEVRNADTFGVLEVSLRDGSYDWHFLPVAGSTFTDSGTQACH